MPNLATDSLGTLGGSTSCAFGINSSGQVVGTSTAADGKTHGFRTAPNAAINPATDDIGTLGSYPTTAIGINDSGQVVGASIPSGATNLHAFRTGPNTAINPATDDITASFGSFANSTGETINAAGNVQGSFTTLNNAQGFVYANGTLYRPVGVRVPFSDFTGMNNADQMSYTPLSASTTLALWKDGAVTQVADCANNGGYCAPLATNNSLQIVGTSGHSPQHAFLYTSGTVYDLNSLILPGSGFTLTNAAFINDRGQIIAEGDSSVGQRWFRLDPAPNNCTVTINSSVQTNMLWPPDNRLVNVGLSATVSASCDANPTISVAVYSNESDTLNASFSPDAKDLAPGQLRLRAERSGLGTGRVYLIVTKASDHEGNSAFDCAAVTVPLDRGEGSIAGLTSNGTSAVASCKPNGTVGSGFVPVGVGPILGPFQ